MVQGVAFSGQAASKKFDSAGRELPEGVTRTEAKIDPRTGKPYPFPGDDYIATHCYNLVGSAEKPEGSKTEGSYTKSVYSAEQQARLGIDEEGNDASDNGVDRLLAGDITAADADDEVKTAFLESVITDASYADRLEAAVRNDPALLDITDAHGRRALDLAVSACRKAMQRANLFLGRYEIADGPPEHQSATCLVVRALDAAAADDYGRLFDEFDDGDGTLDANELYRLAAKLGTNVEILQLEDGSLTKDAFVAKCKNLFGKERKVVIKIFQIEEQWRNEKKARDDLGLDAQFVVQTIPAPGDDEFAKALGEMNLFGEGVGSHAIVMDAADKNLFQIYQTERPDLNTVRVLMRQVMECVQHLHEKGLVHGDIKMLNVVRLSLDNRLRLIDLDAAAKISSFGGEVSYVGSKFSSAVLPPECFAKLDSDQLTQFETYFSDVDAELRYKVAPKVEKRGASYVVKTFSLTDTGAPKTDGLPYELVEASVAVDYWSLGALLFELVAGEPLMPSNRDDDLDGNAMAALATWNDDAGKKRLVMIKDVAAWDLASKLLVRDPDERVKFSIVDALAMHPFFNPESSDAGVRKQLGEMRATLEAITVATSAVSSLSEENRAELRKTRDVLLKAVFEATEVTTPTTFVVLNEKLPELSDEQLKWIENNVVVKDDGSGVLFRGEPPSWWADVEARYKDGMNWADQLAKFKPKEVLTPDNFSSTIKKGFYMLLPTKTLYFYLVDELTGEPIKGPGYPIEITEPAELVSKLLPVMQVGVRAMASYQGVAGVARMFGYPLPLVPEKWRKAAQGTVDLLKQESSVASFGAVRANLKDMDEKKESVRGASLRELKEFFEKEDPGKKYAGLRRIGDPSDGTAVWTLLTNDEDVEKALAERATQRRDEENFRRKDIEQELFAKSKDSVPDVSDSERHAAKAKGLNDSAKGGVDRYAARPLAGALFAVLDSAGPPVCVGLLAKWGSGKSYPVHKSTGVVQRDNVFASTQEFLDTSAQTKLRPRRHRGEHARARSVVRAGLRQAREEAGRGGERTWRRWNEKLRLPSIASATLCPAIQCIALWLQHDTSVCAQLTLENISRRVPFRGGFWIVLPQRTRSVALV